MENLLIYKLRKNSEHLYGLSDEVIAALILDILKINESCKIVPIVNVARCFDFVILKKELNSGLAGIMSVEENKGLAKIMWVNESDDNFMQRIGVARMLANYLEALKNNRSEKGMQMHDTIFHENIFQEHEAFILNILAPDKMFVKQYMIATTEFDEELLEYSNLVYKYLQDCFNVTEEFVYRKVRSLF